MINVKNGDITIDGRNVIFRSRMTEEEFKNTYLYNEVINSQEYGYSNHYIKPQLYNDIYVIFGVYFNPNHIIDSIHLSVQNSADLPSWDNWSESEELEKKANHDEWLLRNIGKPPYQYNWGQIGSYYDSKSGSSMIVIRYNND